MLFRLRTLKSAILDTANALAPHPFWEDETTNSVLELLRSERSLSVVFKALDISRSMVIRTKKKYWEMTGRLQLDTQWIERQLSHRTSERLGESYDRTQFLDDRREMMQTWADYLDKLKSGEVK